MCSHVSAPWDRWNFLQQCLATSFVCQDEAVDVFRRAVSAKLQAPDKTPQLVLLVVGDNGVGKTELAVKLSLALSGRTDGAAIVGAGQCIHKIDCYAYRHGTVGNVAAAVDELEERAALHLATCPQSVIVLEDLQLMDDDVTAALLPSLMRGLPMHNVSADQSTVIVTSNFRVADRTRGLIGDSYVAVVRKLVKDMYGDLLDRATLVALRPYNESGFHAIAHAMLRDWVCARGGAECVVYRSDLLDAMASSAWIDPAMRRDNARSVANIVQQEVLSRFADPLAQRAEAVNQGRLTKARMWFTSKVLQRPVREPRLVVFMSGHGHPWNSTATCDDDVCVEVLDHHDDERSSSGGGREL